MIGDDDIPLVHADALGYCSTRSGDKGCTGQRLMHPFKSKAGVTYQFCDRHWPHRVRLAKQLDAERKRNDA